MKAELVKRQDRWDLYGEDGSKIASSAPNPFKRLSIKNCEAITNGYDLDELAYTESEDFVDNFDYNDGRGNICRFNNSHEAQECYIKGFQKAMELLGDKKFSEEDMRKAYQKGEEDSYTQGGLTKQKEDNYIQSLQQTEWDVEIEMTKEEYTWTPPGEGFEDQAYRDWKEVPKLDADGCLILKRN